MYYSVIGILAIMILMIENQDIFLDQDGAFELPAWKIYRRFLFAGLCYYITDALWGVIAYYKLPKLLFAETTIYFIAMAAGILFWSQYVIVYLNDDDRFGAFFVHAGQAVAAFITIITLVNIFVPVMFTVDADSVYTTQWMRGPVMAIPIVLLLMLSVHALMSLLRQGDVEGIRKKYRTIAWFGIIMAFFMLMQIWLVYLPLNSVAYMLGTCLLRAFVIGDEKEEYRRELIEAERIAGLKQSISALLDNMPALTFSKDAETGVYLACNQAFAEYAHKDKPEGVIGLTDAQIFDSETARHFVEDDRITLERDEPYIFFEDVPDAAGNQRQFQTTKLKFKDADGRLCTLGMCQDVTDLINQRKRAERLEEEKIAYTRISALSGDFLCMYVVVPETGRYREFSSSEGYQRFEIPTEGMDFFTTSRDQVSKVIYPEDIEFFMSEFTEEHVLAKIVKDGMFALKYRLLIDGKPRCVQLKAAMIEEKNGKKIIVGINDIDNLVRQEEAYERRLSKAQEKATVDALTGVKNKYAYVMEEEKLNQQLKKNPDTEFAIVTLDINDLKKINDTDGHQAGDQFIRSACKIICNTFKHSPVFRVGGDEFAIIVRGDDYEQVEELTGKIQKHNNKAMKNGGIIIACGMSRKDGDNKVAPVYERADKNMYENKKALKLERQKVMDIQVS